jgi:hypothetical protein
MPPMISDDLKKLNNLHDSRMRKLYTGQEQATKADAVVADAAAKWFVYRVTLPVQYKKGTPPTFDTVHREFADNISAVISAKNNKAYVDMYAPALAAAMNEVIARNEVPAEVGTAVEAGLMLPTMAKLKHKDTSAYLVKLVEDEKGTHDVVRVYALRALRETMPIWIQQDPDPTAIKTEDFKDAVQNARRAHDIKNVDALTKYIERPVAVTGLSQHQVDAIRYLRREAIIALAQAGSPAVNAIAANAAQKKAEIQKGLVAPTLMKVLVKGELRPEPSMSEKIEAAVGLCNMKYPNMPEYNPHVAVFLVGQTLVEFTSEYNKDLAKFAVAGANKKVPFLPFRADSNRFKLGLAAMVANYPKEPKHAAGRKFAETLEGHYLKIHAQITNAKGFQAATNEANALMLYVPQTRPKTGAVFNTLKVPPIPLAAN